MPSAAQIALAELVVLLVVGCKDARSQRAPSAAPSASMSLTPLLAPRPSGPFLASDAYWVQLYPRLPSSAEWRCAEGEGTIWCAGGEPAAGVVAGAVEVGFRCGPRWGSSRAERICIDRDPEYPPEGTTRSCRFQQEQGIRRICEGRVVPSWPPPKSPPPKPKPFSLPRLNASVIAACWLDKDCPSGKCDRGACSCGTDAECTQGRCKDLHCSEVQP